MSKDGIYLRPSFNDDGTFAGFIDQHGRILCGVINSDISMEMSSAIRLSIDMYAIGDDGSPIAVRQHGKK